ncbi:Uncharacterized protein FWK35_00017881 [Aphis craccivora]|uniref:Uncharacterized protein n=1 Tax=Aphis craccivora TaxID=307492 RepID=A0A6G0YAN7_APHCR|nr:Uncharacterized protein FWK35_00017881 [Aphis craccivora]
MNSERSDECIDFTMIIISRNNATISNYGGGFRCKSEYPWCIIQVPYEFISRRYLKILPPPTLVTLSSFNKTFLSELDKDGRRFRWYRALALHFSTISVHIIIYLDFYKQKLASK